MIHALVVNCQSTIYERLCDTVSDSLKKGNIKHDLVQKSHDELVDILNSELSDIDVVVFSGSSFYLPDSPKIKNAADLMKMTSQKEKYGFGSCFGVQLLAYVLDPEKGSLIKQGSWDKDVEIQLLQQDPIFEGVADPFSTRQYHDYSIPHQDGQVNLGQGRILAKSEDGIEIIRAGKIVGTMFHPESLYASEDATRILQNYLSPKNLAIQSVPD